MQQQGVYRIADDGTAAVQTMDGGWATAHDIEAEFHSARPWTRANIMTGIIEDGSGNPCAAVLAEQLTVLWGAGQGFGPVAPDFTNEEIASLTGEDDA